jgi:membrane protein implicated in regulation of membrane protease activity
MLTSFVVVSLVICTVLFLVIWRLAVAIEKNKNNEKKELEEKRKKELKEKRNKLRDDVLEQKLQIGKMRLALGKYEV